MDGFPTFVEGALDREIRARGMSRQAFALKAGVSFDTITRACRGENLKPKSFGKLVVALGAIPPLDLPSHLVRSA